MRELQLTDVQSGIDDVFAEISALSENCKFTNCTHESEPGCAVQQAVIDGDIENARVNWENCTGPFRTRRNQPGIPDRAHSRV
jgi:putative ribosome biogenesis GTPase RsgA